MRFEYISCNVCGSEDTVYIGKRESPDGKPELETKIVKCRSCGLVYPNPMPRPDEKETQRNFSNAEAYFSGRVTEKRITKCRRTLKAIEKALGRRGKFLDVGCGRGEMVRAALLEGWNAVGCEISKDFADYARRNFNGNVLVGEIDLLDLAEESFDAICLNSVIQYVRDPMGVLRRINRLLKKNSILYIETTNEDALVFRAADLFKSFFSGEKITNHLSPLFPSFQIYGFNKKSLLKALGLAGFNIVSFKVKGITGGGKVNGKGLKNVVVNFARMIIIAIGGIIGAGHLAYCIARKR